ncbi:hypothetical protein [Kitasatospora sp. NBC_01266]|uniref:hypothetical protein n=1 Tax=Kitasatospora sp. NBC_01266 TaxID=2903572 RepID=UPI002E370230|nr:hypothetical protein [Kitasatospora sp. NBC_01266]
MAEKLTALSDLKATFAKNFPLMTQKLDEMQEKVTWVSQNNDKAAGDDDLGKQYKSQVTAPTKNLSDLIQQLNTTLQSAGQEGQNTSDVLNKGDQDAKDQV